MSNNSHDDVEIPNDEGSRHERRNEYSSPEKSRYRPQNERSRGGGRPGRGGQGGYGAGRSDYNDRRAGRGRDNYGQRDQRDQRSQYDQQDQRARREQQDRRDQRGRNNQQDGRNGLRRQVQQSPEKQEASAQIVENNEEFDLPNSIDDFEEMDFLSDELAKAIGDYGFKFPSPVQARSIHIINSGHDMVVQSESGTGKTGAFAIGTLSIVDASERYPQAIIIANTRPLANQIFMVIKRFAAELGVSACLCVGGGKMKSDQNAKVARRSHILVGTPGRLKDIALKDIFNPEDIRIVVMDEADELLKDDFCMDIKDIIGQVSEDTQICTFSATYTETSYSLAKKIMKNPYEIVIEQEKLSTDKIQQFIVMLEPPRGGYHNRRGMAEEIEYNKRMILVDFANRLTLNQAIIFTNHKNAAYRIRDELMRNGFPATGVITSETEAETREKILCQFRLSQIKFLISTDLISRGIDIDDLRCVINFDFPTESETYIHRIGRSGRFGGKGVAINLATFNDSHLLTQLRSDYGITIEELPDIDDVNAILTGFEPPSGKASSSQNYVQAKYVGAV